MGGTRNERPQKLVAGFSLSHQVLSCPPGLPRLPYEGIPM